jgi:hypothetical protein
MYFCFGRPMHHCSGVDTCLTKDREATLLAFFDFPAEHSDIKSDRSVFATVRHRTVRTKGALSAKSMPLRKRGND